MKIKQRRTPRLAFALLALALASSALVTGCKKNHREKIDLSNIQTTAAPETMAPETSRAAGTKAPESSSPSGDGTSGSGSSGSTSGHKGGSTSGSKGHSASAVKNISTKINTYTSGKVSVEYPSVTNMDDSTKAASIDTLLKDNALSVINAYELDEAQDTLSVKCTVLSADRNRITAAYTGTCQKKDGAYPVNIFYSNTVDVGKADNIGFSRFADPYTMAGYVLSGDCEFYNASPELTAKLMEYKNKTTIEAYTEMFNKADFPIQGTFPESFSYEHEGTIFFSIPVPHALGDYAIVKYTPDTK